MEAFNDLEKTSTTISLNLHRFNRLAGINLSGAADLVEKVQLSEVFHQGFGVYYSRSQNDRSNVVGVRSWTSYANGDQKPTDRGITFRLRCYNALKVMLIAMTLFKEAARIYVDKKDARKNYGPLMDAMRTGLLNLVQNQRVISPFAQTDGMETTAGPSEKLTEKA